MFATDRVEYSRLLAVWTLIACDGCPSDAFSVCAQTAPPPLNMDASLLIWCLFDYYVTMGDPSNHKLMRYELYDRAMCTPVLSMRLWFPQAGKVPQVCKRSRFSVRNTLQSRQA